MALKPTEREGREAIAHYSRLLVELGPAGVQGRQPQRPDRRERHAHHPTERGAKAPSGLEDVVRTRSTSSTTTRTWRRATTRSIVRSTSRPTRGPSSTPTRARPSRSRCSSTSSCHRTRTAALPSAEGQRRRPADPVRLEPGRRRVRCLPSHRERRRPEVARDVRQGRRPGRGLPPDAGRGVHERPSHPDRRAPTALRRAGPAADDDGRGHRRRARAVNLKRMT